MTKIFQFQDIPLNWNICQLQHIHPTLHLLLVYLQDIITPHLHYG